jgi:N-acetylglutamate synthase-like GNAT family acetyltransferase
VTSAPVRHESLPYYITTDITKFDFDRVHAWLAASYWAKDIPMDICRRGFENSLSFGLFHEHDGQMGCARMITDRATFAYLADVYISAETRGQKLGRWMMDVVMAHPDLQGLRRMMLATSDMHALYRQVGFTDLAKPEIMMEITVPDIYTSKKD